MILLDEPDPASPGAHLTEPAVTAAELPYWMSRNDHRGRLTELIQLAKGWARMPHLRDAMICDPPNRWLLHGRITAMEFDRGDHINPWADGGETVDENCQTLCKPCNRRKGVK